MRSHRSWGTVAGLVLVATTAAGVSAADPADLCFELASGLTTEAEVASVREALAATISTRPSLFPEPRIDGQGSRLDISSGHGLEAPGKGDSCLETGHEWTARFDRAFLEAGADRMLAEAPTTPGVESAVAIEWDRGPERLRTTLEFAGPFDIPNGTCWIDEQLSVWEQTVSVDSEQGVQTSPFAEGACGRFFDHLPDGGAGEQAVTLLPNVVELPDGSDLRLVAEGVTVLDDALVVSGSLSRD